MKQRDKKNYLMDMWLKHDMLNSGSKVSLVVDGIEYTVIKGKLVVIDIVDIPKNGEVVIDNAFDKIDFKRDAVFKKKKKRLIKLDLGVISELKEDGMFKDCTKLELVKGNKLKSLPAHSFSGCVKLHTVQMSNLRVIGYACFYGCVNLVNFTATRISQIGDNAFDNTKLTKLVCEKVKMNWLSLYCMNSLKYFKADNIDYLGDTLEATEIQYLDIGEFMYDPYFVSLAKLEDGLKYYTYFGLTNEEALEYLKEDTYMARHVWSSSGDVFDWPYHLNDFLTSLPVRFLKEVHYKLNTMSKEEQVYFDKRFRLLNNKGIKVVRE